jgi:PKD repeat protein
VYVADANNHRIQKFDNNGNFITKWGSYGKDDGQFIVPQGVAVDSSGNVYVADNNNHRIQKFAITFGPPFANFSTNVTTGNVPLSVQFNDNSENATQWNWNFGDGTANSTEKNPVHTYFAAGNYTVTLTIYNSSGIDVMTKRDYIIAKQDNTIIWGVAPLSLQFTDQSENATSWKWYFGDGTNSTEQNPKHTYNKAGQYAVSVTVNNMAGRNTATYTGYVNVVNSLEPPVAAFSASPTYGKMPLNVSFTDTSEGSPTSWKWYFGDGANSTEQNPTHVYTKAGQYAVTLSVNNIAGGNSITKLNYISVGNTLKAPVTAFSVSVIS